MLNGKPHLKFIYQDKNDAETFIQLIAASYENDLEGFRPVIESISFKPKVKITAIPGVCTIDELKAELFRSNKDMTPNNTTVLDVYSPPNYGNRLPVTSAIIGFNSLDLFKKIVEKGRTLCFMAQCPTYEKLPIEECAKCLRFGHRGICQLGVRCKNCADSHRTNECKSDIIACVNCIRHNNENKDDQVNISHKTTHPSCPTRFRYCENEKQRLADFQ